MGKQNGHGTVTSPNLNYVGEWKGNDFHGQGTRISTNGTKYVGEWKNGKYNGQVTYTSPKGEKYMGEFKDGKRHGQGTYTFPDGKNWKVNSKKTNLGTPQDSTNRETYIPRL